MPKRTFSKAIIEGLMNSGHSAADVARLAGAPETSIQFVLESDFEFSSEHLRAIESATGRTGGQWAAIGANADAPFVKLMNQWAEFTFGDRAKPVPLPPAKTPAKA